MLNSALDVHEVLRQTLFVTVKMGAPSLLASLIAGVLVSIFQAMTQVSEATLSFVPKFGASVAALLFTGSFMGTTLYNFAHYLFDQLLVAGGS